MAEENKHPPTTEEQTPPEMPGKAPKMEQAEIPDVGGGPAPSAKVIDLSAMRSTPEKDAPPDIPKEPEAQPVSVTEYSKQEWKKPMPEPEKPKPKRGRPAKSEKAAPTEPGAKKEAKAEKPRRGRPPKAEKVAPEQGKPPKAGKTHAAPEEKAEKSRRGRPPKAEKTAPEQGKPPKAGKTHAAPEEKAAPPAPEVPPTPRDATRAEKEEIVYLDLSDLHPFKDHPFGVRDDAEMKSLVESVRNGGVNQPALVRPREGGGYEIIAGHRRQMASQLAGYRNMPCIVRNMTDDEAILAMTDDNLRQRETILPSEKAMSLKMQYEAIKHQGARGDSAEAGKLSLESVGQRNGMSVKTVQRYIWLNDLVPELKQTMDDGKLSFTPAVEISRVRPKHQKYIAVSIEGQQASPSKGQAKRLRELDKENKLSPDVIDGILCEEKKKEDRDVIITGAELEKFFGKEATPRQMKDQIMTLLEDWKERQPPELAKPDKKMDMEK